MYWNWFCKPTVGFDNRLLVSSISRQGTIGMREKATRIHTDGPAFSLVSNPFQGLTETVPAIVSDTPAVSAPKEHVAGETTLRCHVERTQKGGYPIFVERRAAGKTVTIVRNLSGDTGDLLAVLKKRCAAGGKAFTDSVEIQGDHREKVEAILREYGKGIS